MAIYPGRRVTVIENDTEEELKIIVKLHPTPRPVHEFSIASKTFTEVAATEFCYKPCNPDRFPIISVSIGGCSSVVTLSCQHFIAYGKIIFARGSEGRLLVSGIKPRWKDLGRIKGLGHIFGRSYPGRQPEIIE